MTAIDRNPGVDLIQPTKFQLNFNRLNGITYFCQTVNIPGITMTPGIMNTPFIDLYVPGDKMQYEQLTIKFLVDEQLFSWQQIHDWIRAMTFPVEFSEYVKLGSLSASAQIRARNKLPPQYSDGVLSIFTNKNNINFRIQFKDIFPADLSSIQFDSSSSAEETITATASFYFSYYNIEKI